MAARGGLVAVMLGCAAACGARTSLDGDENLHDAGVFDAAPIRDAAGAADAALAPDARVRDAGHDASDGGARVDGGGRDAAVVDAASLDAGDVAPPRLVAPLSTARATSTRPTLRWVLASGADGAEITLCHDRACQSVVTTFRAVGTSGRVPYALARGTYFWRARGTEGARVGADASATWQLSVGAHDAPIDTSWGSAVDPNGDGHADLLVAAPFLASLTGAVQFFPGSATGTLGAPITFLGGDPPFPELGYALGSAGDVDGDGFAEIVLAAPNSGGASPGAVYLYAGASTFPSPSGPTKIVAPGAAMQFGHAVASVGDVNGDGYGDLAIAATATNTFSGGVFLYLGSAHGLVAPAAPFDVARLPAVASAGDVDGDGYGDVLVGDVAAAQSNGAARVYRGGPSGLAVTPITLTVPGPYAYAGYAVAAGDVDGDGYSDVVVGAPGRAPRVVVFAGGPTGVASSPLATLVDSYGGPNNLSIPNVNFGSAVAVAGDVDDDGFADVAVGLSTFGRVYVARGGPSLGVAAPIEISRAGVTSLGTAISGGGDLDADGIDDLLIGAPYTDSGVGRAFVYFGGASFPGSSLSLVGPGARGNFGYSLARAMLPRRQHASL